MAPCESFQPLIKAPVPTPPVVPVYQCIFSNPSSFVTKNKFCWSFFCKGGSASLALQHLFLFFSFSFVFLGLHPRHMEVPRLGVESELQPLAYASHSYGNAGSKPCLFMATSDPYPTEQGQGSNVCPHGCESDSFPLSHVRNFQHLSSFPNRELWGCESYTCFLLLISFLSTYQQDLHNRYLLTNNILSPDWIFTKFLNTSEW